MRVGAFEKVEEVRKTRLGLCIRDGVFSAERRERRHVLSFFVPLTWQTSHRAQSPEPRANAICFMLTIGLLRIFDDLR